jgi:hypothetical protein
MSSQANNDFAELLYYLESNKNDDIKDKEKEKSEDSRQSEIKKSDKKEVVKKNKPKKKSSDFSKI